MATDRAGRAGDDAREWDLRDTAVTWLARAGCTLLEICAITGHQLQSATQVMRHYLGTHAEIAETAMRKLVAWYEGESTKSNHETSISLN